MKARLLLLLLAACAPEVPAAPTWVDDVQPILVANCARCHGAEPRFGAPAGFRLDVYDDTPLPGGRTLRGARSMGEFAYARAVTLGDMPDIGPHLTARQGEIIDTWLRTLRPVGTREGNAAPTVVADGPRTADQELVLDVTVADADRDSVVGQLSLGPETVPLAGGRAQVRFDTGLLAAGDYPLLAVVDDSQGEVPVALGTVTVAHTAGAAPRLRVAAPQADEVFSDGGVNTIRVVASDADPGAVVRISAEAFKDGVTLPLAQDLLALPGGNLIVWNTTGVEASPSWRLRFLVSDGTLSRVVVSEPVIVSHQATTETWTSIFPVFDRVCGQCHDSVVDGADFEIYDDVFALRGLIYRKVVQRREMPPPSAVAVLEAAELLTEDERTRIGNWILGGAPP